MLIAGCVEQIRREVRAPVLATLQGDDLFLEQLEEPYKSQAIAEVRRLVRHIDGFLVFSRYYADFMADYFDIPREKLAITPLGVDTRDFREFAGQGASAEPAARQRPLTVGYLARLAPEKGLHVLVDAFLELHRRRETEHVQLHIAGYLGAGQREYAESQFARLRAAGLEDHFQYVGEVDRRGKVEFLNRIDVLSVPTTHREPKGLFVLEALAAGAPVVQPDHGAFPELLGALKGGRLTRPNDAQHLAEVLSELLLDDGLREELGHSGRRLVHERYNAESMAQTTLEIYRRHISRASV
jgi:glycosyltransferase involved in cell wall biosynthesis